LGFGVQEGVIHRVFGLRGEVFEAFGRIIAALKQFGQATCVGFRFQIQAGIVHQIAVISGKPVNYSVTLKGTDCPAAPYSKTGVVKKSIRQLAAQDDFTRLRLATQIVNEQWTASFFDCRP
jgi:hypothetical protein